jgi:hypothetical protein
LFGERRLNLVNARREFYRNVELNEVESFIKSRGLSAQFIELPEAKEYRESLALQKQRLAQAVPTKEPAKFAESLFGIGASCLGN